LADSEVLQRFTVIAVLAPLLAGCNDGLPTVPVTGQVTFAGSAPPASGTITFMPIEAKEGMPRRPGSGKFSPQESAYEITSFSPGDGLIPGRYEVNITCYTGHPTSAKPETFVTLNAVPENWKAEELVIEEGSNDVEKNYDVPPKKK
jgi:hypothetical protein